MTTSDWKKAYTQLKHKPAKWEKYKKHNSPKKRTCGKAKNKCTITGRNGGHISKYGLHICRQAFREIAPKLGFKKYN